MMWDGKVKGLGNGGGVDKNETGWEEREGAHSPSVRSDALPIRLNWYYPYALLGDS